MVQDGKGFLTVKISDLKKHKNSISFGLYDHDTGAFVCMIIPKRELSRHAEADEAYIMDIMKENLFNMLETFYDEY